MVRLLARIVGVGVETADMLVHEVLSRPMRDRRAVARYAGLTGAPDESGAQRREQGLARAGNARIRRGMIQLAWRFLMFQKESALALWYRARTPIPRGLPSNLPSTLRRSLPFSSMVNCGGARGTRDRCIVPKIGRFQNMAVGIDGVVGASHDPSPFGCFDVEILPGARHRCEALTAPDGRPGRIHSAARSLGLKARDGAAARLRE
jgi:hypothetical protein